MAHIEPKIPLFVSLWTTEFGKVDPVFSSVMIITVPRVGTERGAFQRPLFLFQNDRGGCMAVSP